MIVTVTLDRLWLTPIADLTAGMGFELNGIDYSPAVFVTIGQYAGGNFRPRRQKGTQRSAKVTLVGQSDAQAAFLEAQQGAVLVLRDPRGRKFAARRLPRLPAGRPVLEPLASVGNPLPSHWSHLVALGSR